MKLPENELAYVRAKGLCITEKCDECGKLLNQSFRYTIAGKPDVYCSAICRDLVFFGDRGEARKRATPKVCAHCGAQLEDKKAGALFCSPKCRMRFSRAGNSITAEEAAKSRTATQ